MRTLLRFFLLSCVLWPQQVADAQSIPDEANRAMVDKIKKEGLENSQVMRSISYLTDVHGPRLTGSPYAKNAAKWTLSQLAEWGLENGHLESWGPFGRGWTLEQSSVNLVEPTYAPLIAHVKAWSPSTTRTVRGVPIYLDASTEEELEQYRGKLGRAIVLISPPREIDALFEPPAARKTQEELLRLANSRPPQSSSSRTSGSRFSAPPAQPPATPAETPEERKPAAKPEDAKPEDSKPEDSKPEDSKPEVPKPTSQASESQAAVSQAAESQAADQPAAKPAPDPRALARLQSDKWQMAYSEGAAVVLEPGRGDGGNVFVASVVMPRNSDDRGAQGNRNSRGPRPWASEATDIIPQAVLSAEHYNRLVRMIEKGVDPMLEVDIVCQYYNDDLNSFNIIAEIPGSDLKDEVVMLGGHFDSWQSGTGATDNAVGCGVAMEAIRILKAIDAKPRRTIRLALWTGEEQGLLGSRAYVEEHFGKVVYEVPEGDGEEGSPRRRPQATYHLKPEQEKVSAYFNLDNGTGKIRGIYLQGNEQLRTLFAAWLAPFEDMDASTVSASNTGGTDHQSFDAVGIPGFQFIQDPVEYDTRTHHSSMDVYDRIQEDDVKQASIIMASFVYHTAMLDERLPRKKLNGPIVQDSQTPPSDQAASKTESTVTSPDGAETTNEANALAAPPVDASPQPVGSAMP